MDVAADASQAPPDVRTFYDVLGRKEYHIGLLENQVRSLSAQLKTLQKETGGEGDGTRPAEAPPSSTSARRSSPSRMSASAEAQPDPNPAFEDLSRRHNDLYRRYRELEAKHANCGPIVEAAIAKHNAAKENIKQWKKYIGSGQYLRRDERRERASATPVPPPLLVSESDLVSSATEDVRHSPLNDSETTPRPPRQAERAAFIPEAIAVEPADHSATAAPADMVVVTENGLEPSLNDRSQEHGEDEGFWRNDQQERAPLRFDGNTSLPTHASNDAALTASESQLPKVSQRVTSSQSTVDESTLPREDSTSNIKHEPSSEVEPLFMYAKQVKRGRDTNTQMPPTKRIKAEDGSPKEHVQLHSSEFSSPVIQHTSVPRREISDLDAITQAAAPPPRLRRSLRDSSSRLSSQGQTNDVAKRCLNRTASLSDRDIPRSPAIEDHDEITAAGNVRDFALHPSQDPERALRPLNANIPNRSPKRAGKESGQRKKRRASPLERGAFMSEDAELTSSQVANSDSAVKAQNVTPQAQTSRRLGSLLDAPSTGRRAIERRTGPRPLLPRPAPHQSPPKAQTEPRVAGRALSPRLPAAAGGLNSNTKALQDETPTRSRKVTAIGKALLSRPPHSAGPPLARPQQHRNETPTRPALLPKGIMQPPRPMGPEDEPLRSRPPDKLRLDDFKINPQYMGSDFAFADTFRGREQRRGLQAKQQPEFLKMADMATVQALTGKDDEQTLLNYLGQDWDQIIGSMPPQKRAEMLSEARAHAMATMHGKQKQAFTRRSTPPGYWRADFPTTQDRKVDREKAHELERQKVHSRWREAIKRGGQWMFKDE